MDMNITFGTGSIPYGPSAATRTLDRAGSAALAAYYRELRGLPVECCRGGGLVTARECAAKFRAGLAPCHTAEHGACSKGVAKMMERGE